MAYADLLKDPRWQRKRLEVLQRDDFHCQSCADKRNTLHVHHLRYNGNPWDTPSKFLVTLCNDCHSKEEDLKKRGILNGVEGFGLARCTVFEILNRVQERIDDDVTRLEHHPVYSILDLLNDIHPTKM